MTMVYSPPVFPQPAEDLKGLELRDYFAAQAMNGLLGNRRYDGTPPPELAIWAYNLADVMLEERDG